MKRFGRVRKTERALQRGDVTVRAHPSQELVPIYVVGRELATQAHQFKYAGLRVPTVGLYQPNLLNIGLVPRRKSTRLLNQYRSYV